MRSRGKDMEAALEHYKQFTRMSLRQRYRGILKGDEYETYHKAVKADWLNRYPNMATDVIFNEMYDAIFAIVCSEEILKQYPDK